MKMNYSYNEMLRAFECGRNFQMTGENNFKELIAELTEQEKPAKESEPAKEIISEIICKECGKEGDLDLEGIWCANCQKYTYSEKPAKENIDLMGQIPIISLANSMFGKPTKEEREWEVGDMVRITCQLKGHGFNDGEEVQLLKYDEKDGMWEAEGKNSFWWITTEEAILISNPR